MTQLESAKKGLITDEMRIVAMDARKKLDWDKLEELCVYIRYWRINN